MYKLLIVDYLPNSGSNIKKDFAKILFTTAHIQRFSFIHYDRSHTYIYIYMGVTNCQEAPR
jgi:hypothetical protein